ncbi:MAG: 16S rRNA (adenine(1518)-N(6)/adenine(1519)-N(6))-dimethyltransferase RsmA [Tissierellia bacterium]|nr:16S rRNA (adenine(1518)-N(6)/adenine(1519)-N(6))-dimethyltransferase RsmA [Tissierellia bacterium]
MRKLYSPKTVKELMDFYDVNFSKSLGQNFLVDGNFVRRIVESANVEEKNVIEVGPGIGTLSYEIAQKAKKLVVIEIDRSLVPILNENLSEFSNTKIIREDILKVDINKIVEEDFNGEDFILISNLPYYITTPIIEKFAKIEKCKNMTIMLQKEVAMRILAKESTKDYSALTLFVKFFADVKKEFNVAKTVFMPKPKIDSTVLNLKLRIYDKSVDQKILFDLIHAGFNKRRKTILNSLQNVCKKEELIEIFEKLNISPKLRAENLTLDRYIDISKEVENIRKQK